MKKLGIGLFVSLFLFCLNGNSLFAQNCPLPSIPENWCHCSDLIWDPANPGPEDKIEPGDAVVISVIGGCRNYEWEVSGEGFWFDAAYTMKFIETQTDSTTLYLDDTTACGSATITVTDDCGEIALGYVKSTAGHWEFRDDLSCQGSWGLGLTAHPMDCRGGIVTGCSQGPIILYHDNKAITCAKQCITYVSGPASPGCVMGSTIYWTDIGLFGVNGPCENHYECPCSYGYQECETPPYHDGVFESVVTVYVEEWVCP